MRVPSRLRPLLVPVPFAAGALAAGGVPGILLGFFAALLWLDRLLDHLAGLATGTRMDADRAFRRLDRERRVADLRRRGRSQPAGAGDLAYLGLDTGWAAVAPRHPHGVQPIEVDSIVGSVDAHKAATFDRCFRPPRFSRGRWTLMYRAAAQGAQMPPISVYRVGGEHYVRDGHHRVSVARARGTAAIEAHVVEIMVERSAA